jgi:GntR family transcriptional regulator/MocR family aminotransferase
VYAGTASKTLAPGLRMSWLVLPERYVEPVRTAKYFAGRHNSVIEQLTFAELVTAGHYDQHVRRCRAHYRRRRDRLVGMLGGRIAPAGIAAGLHMVVLLGDRDAEAAALARAARASVAVQGLGRCWMTDAPRPGGIIVGYAAPPEHAFEPALEVLAEVLAG